MCNNHIKSSDSSLKIPINDPIIFPNPIFQKITPISFHNPINGPTYSPIEIYDNNMNYSTKTPSKVLISKQ